ncbi:hypothetical protein Nepgr_030685 [Nepenthes gracilis]|uniref:Uncharacterized protein n=1 Tax=Nepenthes gracilis TaxID=150966 RepID=A0AAD3Y420_NEPGR|nr:hypothetical protein Nepgr_030685 [Nepenthes gracilis]
MASREVEVSGQLVRLCIEAACESRDSVERWRRQRRTLERLPSPIADALLGRLLCRRLVYPSFLELFKFTVEHIDLSGENYVDEKWMVYLGAFRYLRSLNIADCYRITSSALWHLAGMTSLRELDLSRCMKLTDAGIEHLLSIPHLEKLCISETSATAGSIKLLSSLANLSTLDLGGLPVSDLALSSLQVLTKLEYLDVWGSKISDKVAATFLKFIKLSYLNLAWTKITKFPVMKSLECLNMSNCSINSVIKENCDKAPLRKLVFHGSSFTDAAEVFSHIDAGFLSFLDLSNTIIDNFGFLHRLHKLEHLDLSFTMVDDNSVELIACVGEHLRHLNLSMTKISSLGMEILAGNVPLLEVMTLSHTIIDDVAIAYISMMPSLGILDLSYTNIRGYTNQPDHDQARVLSLPALQNLEHLKKLDLSGTRILDLALYPLSSFKELSHLSLLNASLTDDCLPHLSSICKLVDLSIHDALLSDHALHSFKPPATLKVLDLRGCWLLTGDAVRLFCRNHPQLEVIFDLHMPLDMATGSNICTSSSRSSPQILKSKRQGVKSSISRSRFREDILDQRMKYSREELLSLQHSSPSSPHNLRLEAQALTRR